MRPGQTCCAGSAAFKKRPKRTAAPSPSPRTPPIAPSSRAAWPKSKNIVDISREHTGRSHKRPVILPCPRLLMLGLAHLQLDVGVPVGMDIGVLSQLSVARARDVELIAASAQRPGELAIRVGGVGGHSRPSL